MTDLGTDRVFVFFRDDSGEDSADFFGKSGGGPGQFKVRSEDTRLRHSGCFDKGG